MRPTRLYTGNRHSEGFQDGRLRLDHALYSELGCAIHVREWLAPNSAHGRHINDFAGALLAHVWQHGLGATDNAKKISVHHRLHVYMWHALLNSKHIAIQLLKHAGKMRDVLLRARLAKVDLMEVAGAVSTQTEHVVGADTHRAQQQL